jgi:homoaconitase/3-isopropylmalate dehydratase large subunit
LDGAIITTISIYVLISHANDIVIPSCKSILQELHYFGLQQIFLELGKVITKKNFAECLTAGTQQRITVG